MGEAYPSNSCQGFTHPWIYQAPHQGLQQRGSCHYIQSKKKGKDQESIQSSTTLTQDTNGKVTTSQLDITNKSQEASLFPAGDHKARHIYPSLVLVQHITERFLKGRKESNKKKKHTSPWSDQQWSKLLHSGILTR